MFAGKRLTNGIARSTAVNLCCAPLIYAEIADAPSPLARGCRSKAHTFSPVISPQRADDVWVMSLLGDDGLLTVPVTLLRACHSPRTKLAAGTHHRALPRCWRLTCDLTTYPWLLVVGLPWCPCVSRYVADVLVIPARVSHGPGCRGLLCDVQPCNGLGWDILP